METFFVLCRYSLYNVFSGMSSLVKILLQRPNGNFFTYGSSHTDITPSITFPVILIHEQLLNTLQSLLSLL